MIQRVEPLGVDVRVLGALAALDPRLRDGLDAVVCSGDGRRHAGDGVRVPSQGQAVGYRPLQAPVALRKALLGLQAVEDAEDGGGDRVQRRDAVTCTERQARSDAHLAATVTPRSEDTTSALSLLHY